jgi:hypothetical protein
MTDGKRDYVKENKLYKSKPEQVKKREERNLARAHMLKAGRVHKGDGKDVDHIRPLSKGGAAVDSNLRVVSAHTNRSYARTSTGKMK